MTSLTLLHCYLAIFGVYVFLELLLISLNVRSAARHADAPPEFIKGAIDAETYRRSVAYTRARGRLHAASHLYRSAMLLAFIVLSWFGLLERMLAVVLPGGYVHAAAYVLSVILIFDIAAWPLELVSTFVIEKRFGFNKMTLGLWIADKLKGIALSIVLLTPLLLAVLWLMHRGGGAWWVYAFVVVVLFELLLLYLYPVWIAPRFNAFTPLQDAALRERILQLTQRLGFPAADVFVMDGSKRSAHANAYFTGFGRHRRVVLFDTLCALLAPDELLAVLAHEIGHAKLRHLIKSIVASSVLLGAGLWLVSLLLDYAPLYAAFGFTGPSSHAALTLMLFAGGPLLYFISPLLQIVSRRFEYQADRFAREAMGDPESLAAALVALSRQSLSNFTPHPWYCVFHYSHPPLRDRLRSLRDRLP